jgi:cytochrome c peroxidase
MTMHFPLRVLCIISAGALCLGCTDYEGPSPRAPDSGEPKPTATAHGNGLTTAPRHVVTLGDPELTAGIPGSGPLTLGQITKWLADPRNHEALDPKLPLGLDAGQSSIQSSPKNPLTRAKIELGRQLYFDKRLSADGTVSCASCHDPAQGFTAHTQFGIGVGGQTGNRNSPVCYNRILSTTQFWDGRAASLEEQAKGPIANPIEMANTHDKAAATVSGIEGYRVQFQAVFHEDVTIDNIAKAISSFERTIVTGPSAYDYFERLQNFERAYAEDLRDVAAFRKEQPKLAALYDTLQAGTKQKPMSDSARRGRELFFGNRGGCTACHVGANFTDEKYHNLGVGLDKPQLDLGRYVVTQNDKERGAFKTPTVRNAALTAPYMHDGSHKTLEDVVEFYNQGGLPNLYLSDKIKKLNLTAQEKADLVEFMKALTGDLPKVETGRLPQS